MERRRPHYECVSIGNRATPTPTLLAGGAFYALSQPQPFNRLITGLHASWRNPGVSLRILSPDDGVTFSPFTAAPSNNLLGYVQAGDNVRALPAPYLLKAGQRLAFDAINESLTSDTFGYIVLVGIRLD